MQQQNTPEGGTLATATVPADTTDTQHPASVTGNLPQTEQHLLEIEERPCKSAAASVVEAQLLDWLQKGTLPTPCYTNPAALVDALHPKDGGYSLEKCNACRRAWWLALNRLQARVAEFAALTIAEPEPLTAQDFLIAWQTIEGGNTL